MSLSIVNHGSASASASLTTAYTLGWTPTVGNVLVVLVAGRKSTQLTSINPSASDNHGNTYTRKIQGFDASVLTDGAALFAKVATTGAPFTVTAAYSTTTPDEMTVYVYEIAGADTTTPVPDAASNGADSGTSATTGSATNSNANELWLALFLSNDTGNPGTMTLPGAPWTTQDSNTNGSTGVVSGVVSQLVSSVAAQNPAATVAGTAWSAVLVGVQAGLQTIAPNNANIVYSPFNVRANGSTWAQANSSGAYMKLNFTSSILTLLVDVSTLSGQSASNYPVVLWRIDNGTWTQSTLTSGQTSLSLGTGLAAGSHTAEIRFNGFNGSSVGVNRWNSTASPYIVFRVTGFQIDVNGSVAAVTKRSKNLLFYSTSIGEGYNADTSPTAGSSPSGNFNSTYAYLPHVAEALDAEYGMVAYGGSKLTATATVGNNVPGLNPSAGTGYWDHLDDVTSRLSGGLFSPAPDYIIVHHGWNDASASVSGATFLAQLNDLLSKLATAAPNAKVFVVQEIGNQRQYATQFAGATYGTGQYYIDLDSGYVDAFSAPFGTGISSSWRTPDGVHPNSEAHHELAARLVKAIQAKLGGSGASFHAVSTGAMGIS